MRPAGAARILLVLSVSALLHAQLARPPYAITSARVVTAPGKMIEGAMIMVRDGIVEYVGPTLPVPRDMRVYDASGLTIYPGLIDAATHYGFPALPPGAAVGAIRPTGPA